MRRSIRGIMPQFKVETIKSTRPFAKQVTIEAATAEQAVRFALIGEDDPSWPRTTVEVVYWVFPDHQTRTLGQERHWLSRVLRTTVQDAPLALKWPNEEVTGRFEFPSGKSAQWIVRAARAAGVVPVEDHARAVKEVKRCHQECQRREWHQRVPQQIVEWANRIVAGWDLEYCDNVRVADASRPNQKKAYKEQKARGCCGFVDDVQRGPDGRLYWIGCNYGH